MSRPYVVEAFVGCDPPSLNAAGSVTLRRGSLGDAFYRVGSAMAVLRWKLVVIGDLGCGKTSLLSRFATVDLPNEFVAPVFKAYVAGLELDGRQVEFALWDTVWAGDYDRFQPFLYSDSHIFLICYAIDTPKSLDSVMEKWIVEARYFSPKASVLLVGCKRDLRYCQDTQWRGRETQSLLSHEQAQAVARNIGAQSFHECSARTGEGVERVFNYAARAAFSYHKPSKGICVIA